LTASITVDPWMHRAKLIRFLQEAARAGPSFFQITPLVPPCGEELLSATLDLNTVQLQNIGLGTSRKLNRQRQLRGTRLALGVSRAGVSVGNVEGASVVV
jgi:hypothetical protein